jgi:hypothetical protein
MVASASFAFRSISIWLLVMDLDGMDDGSWMMRARKFNEAKNIARNQVLCLARRCGAKGFFKKILGATAGTNKKTKKLTMAALFFVFSYDTPLLLPSFFDATDSAPPTNKLLPSEI